MGCTLTTEEVAHIDRTIAALKSENDGYAGQLTRLTYEVELLRSENAKLRELLVGAFEDMDAWQKVIAGSNEWGYGKGCLDRLCKLRDAMQELGMEVVVG